MFIVNVDGSNLIPLPSAPGGDFDPSWSPDGSKIVFTSLREDGVSSMFLLNLEDNEVTRFGDPKAAIIPARTGHLMAVLIVYVGADNRIYAMSVDGSRISPLIVGGRQLL